MAAKYTLTADDIAATNETASRLGVSPKDLLTAVAYETIGTFNPNITGGLGGRYVGLIQFGPTEQRVFGYRPGMSFADEMRGPVYSYLSARGVKPGMGLGHIYSVILTGGLSKNGQPRWNARDINGSVRTHVANMQQAYGRVVNRVLGAPPEATSEDIRQLQQQLAGEGLYKGKVDGVWGPLTKAAFDAKNAIDARPVGLGSDFAAESRAEADARALNRETGDALAKAGTAIGAATPLPRSRPALLATQAAVLGDRTALRKGTPKAAAVAEVQKFLNDQGYTDAKGRALKVDGDLGVRTRQAIIAYQQDRGLRPDGVVGIKTLADMAAVQEQADNLVTRSQSPEMGGDRFDVAQIIQGSAPGLPGGGIGSDFATSMGARLAVNMNGGVTSPTSIPGEPYGPALAVQDYTPDPGNSGFGDFVRGMVKDAFDAPPASADPFSNASPYTPSVLRPDLAPLESGVQQSAGHYFDSSVHFENADPYEGPGLSADALQFQADLTPSLGGALGSSLGSGGGANTIANVIGAYGRTAREVAALKAATTGRAIQVATSDPFAAYNAAAIAQSNAQTQAFLAAAGAASAAVGTSGGTSPGGFNPGINSSPGNNSRASGTDSPGAGSTSPGTSPSGGGSRPSNTVSNPGSLGGSSTSPGTSSANSSRSSNTSTGTSRF